MPLLWLTSTSNFRRRHFVWELPRKFLKNFPVMLQLNQRRQFTGVIALCLSDLKRKMLINADFREYDILPLKVNMLITNNLRFNTLLFL
jgi:hypothetical protein